MDNQSFTRKEIEKGDLGEIMNLVLDMLLDSFCYYFVDFFSTLIRNIGL